MFTLETLKKLAHVFNCMSNYIIFKMFSGFCRHGTGDKRHAITMQMADAGSISSKICITKVVEKIACHRYTIGGNAKRDYKRNFLSTNDVALGCRFAATPKMFFTSPYYFFDYSRSPKILS